MSECLMFAAVETRGNTFRERERERERDKNHLTYNGCMYSYVQGYIGKQVFIYLFIFRHDKRVT